MGSILGMIIGIGMGKGGISGMRAGQGARMECWNYGGCAGLGNLYILTVVIAMINDSI